MLEIELFEKQMTVEIELSEKQMHIFYLRRYDRKVNGIPRDLMLFLCKYSYMFFAAADQSLTVCLDTNVLRAAVVEDLVKNFKGKVVEKFTIWGP